MKIFLAAFLLILLGQQAMAQQASTAWLGASSDDLTQEDAEKLGLKSPRGAKVTNLVAGGPAESAGLNAGDILVTLDGAEIADVTSLNEMTWAKAPGTAVTFSIRRDGIEKQLRVTLGTRPFKKADDGPQLMLDTGGHMASVIGLAVTPDGQQLVSASNDKTIRIWDIASGKTQRLIRGESAAGDWGTIYAMALSPDGRWLATGGYLSQADPWTASAVRLFDFATGQLVATLKGHQNVVTALAFSPDSKRLISSSADKRAIIWDVAARQQLMRLTGHTKRIGAVSFSTDGVRVVTGSDDGILRLWSVADGKMLAELTEHQAAAEREQVEAEQRAAKYNAQKPPKTGAGIGSVAYSRTENLFASSSTDGRILLWDGTTGAFLRQLANPGGMVGFSSIESVQFSSDGKWLLAASEFQGCSLYDVASGGEMIGGKLYDKPPSFMDKVERVKCGKAVVFTPDGKRAAGGYNSQINIIDALANSAVRTLQGAGSTIHGVGIAPDAKTIAWGNTIKTEEKPKVENAKEDKDKTGEKVTKLLRRMRLPADGVPLGAAEDITTEAAGAPGGGYLRGSNKQGALSLRFRPVSKMLQNMRYLQITKDDQLQTEIDMGGLSLSGNSPMTFTPGGQTALIGGIPDILAYDLSGKELTPFVGHGGMLRDLVASADGRFLVSGGADQTVRLWNLQTRELIVSIFDAADGEWVVWTPQGYYASSPNGDRIVGWQINKGADQAAEYVTASQLRNKFYRPDIVDRAIMLASATKALEESDPSRAGFRLTDLAQRLPPKLGILSPRDGAETANGRAIIELALGETADDPVNRFDVFVNDTKVTASAKRESGKVSFEIPLGQGNNSVRMVARSASDLLGEARLDIVQRGEGALDKRGTLFILAIGADKYPRLPKSCGRTGNAACDLDFAGADAKVFAETIEKQMGRQHRRIVRRVLVNGAGGELEPTRANVISALETLSQAKDTDTVTVFIAGHGTNDTRNGYQFLPSDAQFADGTNLSPSSVVQWAVLENAIQSAKGRRLLFVDTCRSTNAFNPRLMKDASDDAIVAFSATNTQQDALELPSLGHGAFTNAVVQGLKGAADIAQEREVRVFDLGAYVEREVRKLTKGLQTPDFYKRPGAENFVVVRLADETSSFLERPTAVVNALPAHEDMQPPKPATTTVSTAPDRPVDTKPKQADKLVDVRPADKPAQVKTAAKPADPVPADRPADVKPADKPADVKTAAKPADTKPAAAETKPPVLLISPSEEAARLKRGQAALALDDVAAARLIFEYLANRGSAAGAYELALTYDPQAQARGPLGSSFQPDEQLAERWYLKAAELGHPEARKKTAAKK